ncbi:Uncharacterised protein [uncultured archaeon]|nr:Uncharacterised protein [uncultured archaeon]
MADFEGLELNFTMANLPEYPPDFLPGISFGPLSRYFSGSDQKPPGGAEIEGNYLCNPFCSSCFLVNLHPANRVYAILFLHLKL